GARVPHLVVVGGGFRGMSAAAPHPPAARTAGARTSTPTTPCAALLGATSAPAPAGHDRVRGRK
ncbi:hypothetical protein, partial [Nonomuraea sp. NPDC050691]|uniref:hypothetical protein n=1 Tax=Nonomuraea sp. NPDC050691 TaxID=3155661 RepID=UPI0033E0DF22